MGRSEGDAAGLGEQASTEQPLIIDELHGRLAQFRLLYDSDDDAADGILNELGGQGKVEREIVRELAATQALARPERFAEAHAVAMHALEVMARNGSRPPSQLRAGPLTGLARYFAQQVIRFIVRSYQAQVIDSIRDLYTRRLAWMPAGDPARLAMVRARLDAQRATPSYKGRALGVPTFLVGGAAVSSTSQVLSRATQAAVGTLGGRFVLGVASVVLLVAASWVVLRGAAIARRRIRLTMDPPLAALWETVGWCGHPPKDAARTFAAVAIVLTVLGWLAIPLSALLVALL